jgi:hypothetical protein
MASSHETIYWDSLGHSLLNGAAYRVELPSGTTEWTVINVNAGATDMLAVAGTAASIASAANRIPLAPTAVLSGKGGSLFVANGTGAPLSVIVMWGRHGRQPTNDAGRADFITL